MINYPTSLDTLSNPVGTDKVNNANAALVHSTQHSNANDAIEALEAKVGIDGSAVTTSHDYKLSSVTSTAKAVSTAGDQSIAGTKTFTNDIRIVDSINDNNGNEVIKLGTTSSAVNEVSITNAATGNAPLIAPSGDDTNIDIAIKGKGTGKTKLGLAGLNFPDADGANNTVIKSDGAGSLSFVSILAITGTPRAITLGGLQNTKIVEGYADSMSIPSTPSSATPTIQLTHESNIPQVRDLTADWANADEPTSAVIIGQYMYVLVLDNGTAPDTYRVYRYAVNDLSAGGTLMSFSGAKTLTTTNDAMMMTSDGTSFYFTFEAGNSANSYVLAKYSLSGTTFTYVSSITLGSTAITSIMANAAGNFYGKISGTVAKYNSSGTLQYTTGNVIPTTGKLFNILDNYYFCAAVPTVGYKVYLS